MFPAAWPAYSAIDWSDLGTSLADRHLYGQRPLAPKTVERIRRALAKFAYGAPVVIPVKSVFGSDRSVVEPFATQTAQQEKALVTQGVVLPVAGNTFEWPNQVRAKALFDALYTQHTTISFGFAHMPALVEMRGGGSLISGQHPVVSPAHSVTAGGMHHGLVVPPALFTKINGGPGDTSWHEMADPLNTITAHDTHGLLVLPWLEQYMSDPAPITEALATVMSHARHALVSVPAISPDEITDEQLGAVRFRMLEPDPELRRAMGFEAEYRLLGNKRQQTAGLGNAVTPPVATWIAERMFETLDGSDKTTASCNGRTSFRKEADLAAKAILDAFDGAGRRATNKERS
ncbi:MAG: hypothetical protein ACYCS4_07935 [Acidimicrobiales bacterium]